MPTQSARELHFLVENILTAAGADVENAGRVAKALVLSNLSGVETHGVHHLPSYVEAIRAGETVPRAKPEVVQETPTTALVKGSWTFGFVSAMYALKLAIERARRHNVAVVSVVQVNHIGRLGEYAETAADQGWCPWYGPRALGWRSLRPFRTMAAGPSCTSTRSPSASPPARSPR